jgi:hypothetical protein
MFQGLEDHLFLEFAYSHQGINHRDNLHKGTCWNVDYFYEKRQEAKPKFMKRRRLNKRRKKRNKIGILDIFSKNVLNLRERERWDDAFLLLFVCNSSSCNYFPESMDVILNEFFK